MAEATVKPIPQSVPMTIEEVEYVADFLRKIRDLATHADGLWVDDAKMVLLDAGLSGPGRSLGEVHLWTTDNEEIEVVFKPSVTGL